MLNKIYLSIMFENQIILTIVLGLENLVAEVVALDITSDPSEVLDTVSGGSGSRGDGLEHGLLY